MELEKFDRQLRLMVLLTQNRSLTVDDICKRLQISRRSIYRYIDAFKQMGFIVEKSDSKYRLDHASPFFKEITERIHFSEDEAITLNRILNNVYDNTPEVRHLRDKLSSLYDPKILSNHGVDEHVARNISKLYEAIRNERVVVLRDYLSPSKGTRSDRFVEPFMFLDGNTDIRCYEIESGMNKTFRVSRAKKVEMIDLLWTHKDKHMPFFTDLFHFSGEIHFRVKLLLGYLAMSLLIEEHPGAEKYLTLQDDGRHLLDIEVCSYKGIGRFTLGLYDDIEIVDSPGFSDYMNARVKDLTQKTF